MLKRVLSIVGRNNVLLEDLSMYNSDWLHKYHGRSPMVVTPQTTEQVSELLQFFNEMKIPIVTQGGNTGLVGGSVPIADEVIISIKKMNKILNYDTSTQVLTAESGCILEELNQYLKVYQSHIPWDLGARGSCQLGGNISTNAGGLNVIRNGLLRNYILGLEVVKADGTILNMMNTNRKDNTGIDVKQLFIGAEGVLGVITKANVLCKTIPAERRVFFLELDSYAAVVLHYTNQIALLSAVRPMPVSAFEFIEGRILCLRQEEMFQFKHDKYYVIIEFQDQKLNEESISEELIKHTDVIICDQNEHELQTIWDWRESVAEQLNKKGFVLKYDLSIPPEKFEWFVEQVYPDRQENFNCFYGHVGDGNIHFNIVFKTLEELHKEEERIELKMFKLVRQLGGSISAEHGIGQHKTKYMELQKGIQVNQVIKELKELFDPNNILNPGKMIQ